MVNEESSQKAPTFDILKFFPCDTTLMDQINRDSDHLIDS